MNLIRENTVKYVYKAYGLYIESAIELPELLIPGKDEEYNIDVTISYGMVSGNSSVINKEDKVQQYNIDEVTFYIDDIAHYYIYHGKLIIIEPCLGVGDGKIKVFLLGCVFGIMLLQRKSFALHGGCIGINEQAFIFTGDSGAGKSTLTSALRQKGYTFISDEISVIDITIDNKVQVFPSFPQQRLCRDTLELMGYNHEEHDIVAINEDKYSIKVHENFTYRPLPIKAILELSVGDNEAVEINEVFGTDKVRVLLSKIYMSEINEIIRLNPEYVKKSIDIAKHVQVFKIKRPRMGYSVNEQIDILENIINT